MSFLQTVEGQGTDMNLTRALGKYMRDKNKKGDKSETSVILVGRSNIRTNEEGYCNQRPPLQSKC